MSTEPKQHWRKLVNKDSPHLTVWDIDGKSPVRVTIDGFGYKSVHSMKAGTEDGSTEDMLFLRFRGAKKELGVKTTNCVLIEKALGTPYPADWIGKTITLRTALCRGEPCIRVDAPAGTKLPKLVPRFQYTDRQPSAADARPAPARPVQTGTADEIRAPDLLPGQVETPADDLPL
jgi:hypothetical protein